MSEFICPKCHASMRTYERNGINIEQCTECRGVFLDRGELEHLTAAEARWEAPAAQPPAAQPSAAQSSAQMPPKKRKRSFLEDLFE